MDLNEIDDIALWSLLIEGNLHALEVIYKRYYTLLLNYGMRFSQDIELTKDCIQDVFLKLHKSKNLAQTVSPRAYLLKALRHTLYDNLLLVKDTMDLDEYAFYIPESQDQLERLFLKDDEDMQLSRQLLKALKELPSNQKTILYLRFVKGLSHKEIAEIMNINVQSSMNLISRSLTKLRGLLHNDMSPLLFLL